MYLTILLIYVFVNFDDTTPAASFMPVHSVNHIPIELRKLDYYLVCKLQPNGYHCNKKRQSAKFYFDTRMKTCMTFEYADCDFSHNQFDKLHECNNICMESLDKDINEIQNLTTDIVCRLQPDFGKCNKYYPMFYFDISTRKCIGFSYSGCGGNPNRFPDEFLCKAVCSEAVPVPNRV